MRPRDLFDRDREWADLDAFVTSDAPGLQVGILYGRRRLGKSFLLRRLARRHGGLYRMALEEEPRPALQRFADDVARRRGLPQGTLRFADWDEALRTSLAPARTPDTSAPELVILDELPYLLAHPLGAAVPSVLQSLVDESRDDSRAAPRRVLVCGSALALMSGLLSGSQPLRGRATLNLLLRPFDYRTTSAYFGVTDPEVGLRLHAVFGGVPGYRDLLGAPSPSTLQELDELLLATVLNPSHALFDESAYLLREDPRVRDRALYHSVLGAIAAGATTPSRVAAAIGRQERSLAHALDVLVTAGFVRRDDDLLLQRRPVLRLTDGIVRFHELVTAPRLAAFEDRRTAQGWADAQPSFAAQILGPHFEELARVWTARFAADSTLRGPIGEVGSTVVNDATNRSVLQIDVVALTAGQRRQARSPTVRALGEAKSSDRTRGLADLTRLERARDLLVTRGVDATDATLLLFGRSGFDPALTAAATGRDDVVLVDLERLWTGE